MAEISFYARGDSGSANNPSLNVRPLSQVPSTLITFTSGANGDILLDYNGGLPDPDTQVIINGTSYSFTVALSGTLPQDGALSNVNGVDLRGERVIIIEAAGQRWFFLPDAGVTLQTMNAFPNGARSLANVVTGGDPVIICFTAGTMILTPDGERAVETLCAGDLVINGDGEAVAIVWIGHTRLSRADLERTPALRPIRLPEGLFGPKCPSRPLYVSPQHRILVEGWQVALVTGTDSALVPARHLVSRGAFETNGAEPVDYFHLLFENHEIVVSNGLKTESLQPCTSNIRNIASEAKAEFDLLFPDGLPEELEHRPSARVSLKAYESRVVLQRLAET